MMMYCTVHICFVCVQYKRKILCGLLEIDFLTFYAAILSQNKSVEYIYDRLGRKSIYCFQLYFVNFICKSQFLK